MKVSGKVCIGGIIGIIASVAVLSNVFHINTLPALSTVGFYGLISIPIIFWSKGRKHSSRQRVINVCIHDLELARDLLMAEGKISKHDIFKAEELIGSGEICVYLLEHISWEGIIPDECSSFALSTMRRIAKDSNDSIEVNRW